VFADCFDEGVARELRPEEVMAPAIASCSE
jgi:hypothetical protein